MTYLFNSDRATADRSDASSNKTPLSVKQVTQHLTESILRGRPWQEAILEAMERWTLPSEIYHGVRQQYLIHGEAFDWLSLARRLANESKTLSQTGNGSASYRQDISFSTFLLKNYAGFSGLPNTGHTSIIGME